MFSKKFSIKIAVRPDIRKYQDKDVAMHFGKCYYSANGKRTK